MENSSKELKKISLRQVHAKDVSYLRVKGKIPIELPMGAFVSIERIPAPKIYSFGFQPAKSIPEIPQWFLQKYSSKRDKILDPFAGAGTSIMEVLRFGAIPFWTDYHPLSQLICRAKTTEFDLNILREACFSVLNDAKSQRIPPHPVSFANKEFWFQKEVSETLETIRGEIEQCEPSVRDFLLLVFACTVRKVSDMNDGMLLAARRSHIKPIPKRTRHDVYKAFQRYAEQGLSAVEEWQGICSGTQTRASKLPTDDARQLNKRTKFDSIITSPPYINAIDYVWASKFELHWLGLIANDKERLELYSKEIGTERIPSSECYEIGKTGNKHLDNLIEDIYFGKHYKASSGQNRLRAKVVWKYFIDMREHFEVAYRVLKPGGLYCFSVGDSCRICGVKIPVASFLSDVAEEEGFAKCFVFHVLLKNRKLNVPRNVLWADTIKHDTVVVFERH